MSKKGKVLEQLVKTIEEQIKGDPTLRVRSNVKIKNSNGIPREFDVVVDKPATDSSEIIVYECKDHKAAVDIKYVDSFYGKCSNVSNIARKILVSSSGFSDNATIEARSKGIELRTVSDIMEKDDSPKYDVAIGLPEYQALPDMLFFTLENDSDLHGIMSQDVKEIKNDDDLDFYSAFSSILNENSDLFERKFLEALYESKREQMDILSFIQEPFTIVTDSEEFHATSLGLRFHIESHFISQEMTSQRQYGDPGTIVSEFEIKGTKIKTSIIRSGSTIKMYFNDDPYLVPLEEM